MKITVELCCGTLEAARKAFAAGADRIELCADLSVGGVTPAREDIAEAVRLAEGKPVHVLVRPRGGNFVYNEDEVQTMLEDIFFCGETGAAAVVIGALTPSGNVDLPLMERLTDFARAQGLGITFHRAIDEAADIYEALDEVIGLGVDRVLSSGGAPTAYEGRDVLAEMVRQAEVRFMDALPDGQKVLIMPGCGVSGENAKAILEATGAVEIHGTRLSILDPFRDNYFTTSAL